VVPRLIATDLDGTVVRHDGVISDRTRAALKLASESGAEVVFVTGRPPRWLGDVAAAFGHVGFAICGNGALVVDLREDAVIERHLIPAATALEVTRRLRPALPGVVFAAESEEHGIGREPDYVTRFDTGLEFRVAAIEDLVEGPLVKLLARHEGLDSDAMLGICRPLVAGLVEVTHSTVAQSGGLLEISARGVSKASTLSLLCAARGLGPDDVVAFGDMPNDLAMLRWAGTAYAMASGHPEVIAATPLTAPPCNDDGVAQVLEEIFA
jgi:hydroxymethylpyrimidine pyrophosphatase-like HAD family hydrolase